MEMAQKYCNIFTMHSVKVVMGLKSWEALTQHLRALLVGKVAPDADELKVYDAVQDEFLEQARRYRF